MVGVPNLAPEEFITLLPILNGYCDSTTLVLSVTKTNDFEPDSDPDKFRVTIPVATVITASFFDPDRDLQQF